MLVSKDVVTKVIRMPVKPKIEPDWAVPVLVGDFMPGVKKPTAVWGHGQPLRTMANAMLAQSPEFQKLGLKPFDLDSGLELGDEEGSLQLADPDSRINRLRGFGAAVSEANDTAVKSLQELVAEANELAKGGDKVPQAKLDQFGHKYAPQFDDGPLAGFANSFSGTAPRTLVADATMFGSVFTKAGAKPTRDTVLAAVPAAVEQAVAEQTQRAKDIRATFETVADTFASALAYCLNAGFEGEFCAIHVPRTMAQAQVAAFVIDELVNKKPVCADVILLNPMIDPGALTTHWAVHFNGVEAAQATIFASLGYRTLEELDAKASVPWTQRGSAAAHFCVTAGYGMLLGRRTPIGPALAGARRKRDGLLNPRGGHYGLLESSFGCQEDKALFGFESIDALDMRDSKRDQYAKNGINTPGLTDGIVHPFRAVSLSKDRQLSQYDTTRAANWLIGTMREYMRKVTIGQCADPVMKARVANDVTELLNQRFLPKPEFDVVVTPGKSSDPREFVITITLPDLAYVETVTIYVQLQAGDAKK